MRNLSFFSGISRPCLAPASTINFNSIGATLLRKRDNKLHNKSVLSRKQSVLGGGRRNERRRKPPAPKNKKIYLTTRCDKSSIKSYTVDGFLSCKISLHSN